MPSARITTAQRRTISERAHGCCEYCRSQLIYGLQSFTVEHIIPIYSGGSNDLDNLALSCQGCNGHKHTKTYALDPVSNTNAQLYHPRLQQWSKHFAWSADASMIIGLTPTGRATVDALHLNRPNVVNLRRVLYRLGLHPPREGKWNDDVTHK